VVHDRRGEPEHALLHAVEDRQVELRLGRRDGDGPSLR
jgi:hypothetical protein